MRPAKGQLKKAERAVANMANSYLRWNHAAIDKSVIYLRNEVVYLNSLSKIRLRIIKSSI